MSLLSFFQWCYATSIGETIRNSTWMFPVLEAFHLIALAFLAGSILIVDLRLLGAGVKSESVASLADGARPWMLGALAVMAASGIPLFLSESIKCYYSFAFWVKMISLLLVLTLTFTIRRRVTHAGMTSASSQEARFVAIASLLLWFGVAWGGRWIGFS